VSALVPDASVFVKLLLREPDASLAERVLLGGAHELIAPQLLWAEVGNVLWKRARSGQVPADTCLRLLNRARRIPMRTALIDEHIEDALEIAVQTGRTVYDSLYLALAIAENAILLTADERFANAIRALPVPALKDRVRLLAEFA